MKSEAMQLIYENKDLLFTFKSEAIEFGINNGLELNYNDGDMIDNEHFEIKGYKSKIYWIAR